LLILERDSPTSILEVFSGVYKLISFILGD
jgi:hypothetical protein